MKRSLQIWKFIEKSLDEQIPVVLLYVLESRGSSPGRQGFFMAVNNNGEMEGSIGGGIMEHKFVELAKQKLSGREEQTQLRKQHHDKSATRDQSGMICSGEQTIWISPLQQYDKTIIRSLINSLQQNQEGTLSFTPGNISFSSQIPGSDYLFDYKSNEDWQYTERTGFKNQLSIIGAGHCSLALSKLMSDMDFYIRVYDDRDNLKTMMSNDFANEKYTVSGFEELGTLISEGKNHYVVIMTFGYRTDDIALRSLVGKKFTYLGLLGSANKIKKMFDDYKVAGLDQSWLETIHSPIGVQIHSQTPEEIAISIAAEIIAVKNGNNDPG
jgi:xanthine dehydrogenase accessory factor